VRGKSVQLQIVTLIHCPLYDSTVTETFEKNCTTHLTGKHCSASCWVLVNVDGVAGARSWCAGVKSAACISDAAIPVSWQHLMAQMIMPSPYSRSWIARSSSRLCTAGVRWLGIGGTKREEATGYIRQFHDERLNIIHSMIYGKINARISDRRNILVAWGMWQMPMKFKLEKPKGKDYLLDVTLDGMR